MAPGSVGLWWTSESSGSASAAYGVARLTESNRAHAHTPTRRAKWCVLTCMRLRLWPCTCQDASMQVCPVCSSMVHVQACSRIGARVCGGHTGHTGMVPGPLCHGASRVLKGRRGATISRMAKQHKAAAAILGTEEQACCGGGILPASLTNGTSS